MTATRAKSETDADATEEVQVDNPTLYLDDAGWRKFRKALESPAVEKPRLAKSLTEKSVLERHMWGLFVVCVNGRPRIFPNDGTAAA